MTTIWKFHGEVFFRPEPSDIPRKGDFVELRGKGKELVGAEVAEVVKVLHNAYGDTEIHVIAAKTDR